MEELRWVALAGIDRRVYLHLKKYLFNGKYWRLVLISIFVFYLEP